MKRWMVFAVSVMLFICGCSRNGGYTVKTLTDEAETDYSTVYAQTFEFGGLENKEYQSELNEELLGDTQNAINEFDKTAMEAAETLPEGVKSTLNITQKVTLNKNGIISFITENYTYLGGAHGMTVWIPYTINAREENPHRLELRELFKTDEDYIDTINRLIDELVEADPEKYSGLWAEPHINAEDNQEQFYLTDEDLVIFFPPYDLSYYAKGFIEFPIHRTELKGLLKEEYRIKE